jgi:hypothetical protein
LNRGLVIVVLRAVLVASVFLTVILFIEYPNFFRTSLESKWVWFLSSSFYFMITVVGAVLAMVSITAVVVKKRMKSRETSR